VNTSGNLTGGGATDAGADTITLNVDAATTGNATFTFATATTVDINANNALTMTNIDLSASGTAATIAGDSLVTGSVDVKATGTLAISGSAGYKDTGTFPGVSVTNTGTGAITMGATTATAGLEAAATFTGGSGIDTISFPATTKANTMGAGKDIAYFTTAALGSAGSVDLGDDVDTVGMTFANAVTASSSELFEKAVTNFEALNLRTTAAGTVNVANLNSVDAVTLEGALTHAIVLSGLPEAATITQKSTNTSGLTYTLADATGTADSLNLVLTGATTTAYGSSTAASIETINITSTDSVTTDGSASVHTATLVAANASSINVTGNAGLNLTSGSSTAVTSMDASAVTGTTSVITYTSANVTTGATPVIKGGAAADVLTGAALAETIEGGAGNDVIEGNTGVDTLTGGAGNDTFNFETAELLGTDIVSGGDGTDVIGVTNATNTTTVVDADFTNMTSVETLTMGANLAHTLTLGASSLAAGIATVTATGSGTNIMTVGAGHAGSTSLTGGSGTDTFTVSGVPAGNTTTIAGGNGTNGYTIGPATEIITGGSGADTITVTAPASLSAADVINGGAGASDAITFGATGTITDAQFTGVSGVEIVNLAAAVTTITLGAQASEGGITTVNAGAVGNGSQNTIDLSGKTTATAIVGQTGSEVITGSAQVETYDFTTNGNTGTGVDVVKFGATGAANGTDVFGANFAQASTQWDFSAFNPNLTFNATVVQEGATADINITNKITKLSDDHASNVAEVDSAADVVALIQGIANELHINSGGKAVIVTGNDNNTPKAGFMYYVDDTLDGTNGTISVTDVTQIATLTVDIDLLTAGNFI
jgi:hypothetical protein